MERDHRNRRYSGIRSGHLGASAKGQSRASDVEVEKRRAVKSSNSDGPTAMSLKQQRQYSRWAERMQSEDRLWHGIGYVLSWAAILMTSLLVLSQVGLAIHKATRKPAPVIPPVTPRTMTVDPDLLPQYDWEINPPIITKAGAKAAQEALRAR